MTSTAEIGRLGDVVIDRVEMVEGPHRLVACSAWCERCDEVVADLVTLAEARSAASDHHRAHCEESV